jgi:hypothetical protein
MPQLRQADVAQPDPRDQALVARRHQGGQLIIEARIDPAVTGQPQVHRRELAGPQAAEVVRDARAQQARLSGPGAGGGPAAPDGDLADDRQLLRVGVERLADQVVDRPVVLGRVDVIDTRRDGGPQDGHGCCRVGRRVGCERPVELHGAVPGPPDELPAERER